MAVRFALLLLLAGCAPLATEQTADTSAGCAWSRPINLSDATKQWLLEHLDDPAVRADVEAVARHNMLVARTCPERR